MSNAFPDLLVELLQVTAVSRQERPMADWLQQHFKKHRIPTREDASAAVTGSNCGNLLAWPKGTDVSAAETLFCCHMDTVDVGTERQLRVTPQRIEAAGTFPVGIDDRMGMALILRLLAEQRGAYACAFTTQEEIGMFGAAQLAIPPGIKQVYVLDGSQRPGHFVLSTVGCVTFVVTLAGQSAHAGISPNGGRSAALMAARAIAELPLGMPADNESINIGVVHAGTRSNVIPGTAEVVGEVRANSAARLERTVKKVHDTFAKHAKALGGSMTFTRDDMFKPYAHKATAPIVKRAIAAIQAAGLEPIFGHYRGGSDANAFNQHGVPAINLSTGAHNPHSPKEFADRDEFEQAYAIVRHLAATCQ